jgi:tetratricopeptide (TPR) repeat protein
LALDPIEFPDAWFANGVGYFHLNDLAGAEKSARRGLAVDGDHHVPRLEYLLALVLMGKNDYPEAALHFQAFLRRATTQTEIAETQKQLDEVARLSAAQARSVPVSK